MQGRLSFSMIRFQPTPTSHPALVLDPLIRLPHPITIERGFTLPESDGMAVVYQPREYAHPLLLPPFVPQLLVRFPDRKEGRMSAVCDCYDGIIPILAIGKVGRCIKWIAPPTINPPQKRGLDSLLLKEQFPTIINRRGSYEGSYESFSHREIGMRLVNTY